MKGHTISEPWLCIGDYNDILTTDEKNGRKPNSPGRMQRFRDMPNNCGFIDLGFRGPKFTWCSTKEMCKFVFGKGWIEPLLMLTVLICMKTTYS